MSINYAEKYSSVVDERFRLGALTNGIDNYDYDWIGVETVNVFSIPTVAMNNYTLTGSSRYGSPAELENVVQELKVARDRSFTFSIDRKSVDDTMGVMNAAAALRRQIDEVIIPEIDAYKLSAMVAGANSVITMGSGSGAAYGALLDAGEALDDKKVPAGGRIAFVSPSFYNALKKDDSFIKKGDMSQMIAINGVVGEADGVIIVKVPSSYLPANVKFVMGLMGSMPCPIKLADYKVHENPPGINGYLIEGRLRYDAFVLTSKADSLVVCTANGSAAVITPSNPTIHAGEKITLTAKTSADTTGATLAFTSASTTYATVSGNEVTGVAEGSSVITAAWTIGTTVVASAQTTVTVLGN